MKKILLIIAAMAFIFTACAKNAGSQTDTTEDTESMQQETAEEVTFEQTEEPTAEPAEEPTSEPLPNLVAVVVARDSYASAEFNPVMDALGAAGYDTVIVSDELGTANGRDETSEVEKIFTDLSPADLRGIVLIGGSESLWENAELHSLLLDMQENDRVTAAICLSSVTLAKSGVIGEGNTACWYNCESADNAMQEAGVLDSGTDVYTDGLIITGDGPSSAEQFASQVVAALDGMG